MFNLKCKRCLVVVGVVFICCINFIHLARADTLEVQQYIENTKAYIKEIFFTEDGLLNGTSKVHIDGGSGSIGIGSSFGNAGVDLPQDSLVVENRVGIGTDSPSVVLDVRGAGKITKDLTVDTDTLYVDSANDNVGIGTLGSFGQSKFKVVDDTSELPATNDTIADMSIENPRDTAKDDIASVSIKNTDAMWSLRTLDNGDFAIHDVFTNFGGNRQVMTFKDDGNVGIGTNSPESKLDIDGVTNMRDKLYMNTNNIVLEGGWLAHNDDDDGIYINNNNKVGIGTDSPNVKLDVRGAGKITNDLTVDTETLYVDSNSNNVGIGTTNVDNGPGLNGSKLQIKSDIDDSISIETPPGQWASLVMADEIYGYNDLIGRSVSKNTENEFRIRRFNGGSDNYDVLSIDRNDYVGIGTTNPEDKLDVKGQTQSYGFCFAEEKGCLHVPGAGDLPSGNGGNNGGINNNASISFKNCSRSTCYDAPHEVECGNGKVMMGISMPSMFNPAMFDDYDGDGSYGGTCGNADDFRIKCCELTISQ